MRPIDADALEQSCKEIIADDWNKRTSPVSWADAYEEFLDELENAPTVDIKTEVAREIFAEIEKQIARYSHIHRYADEARRCTEEYADGTPCEMVSVWEVIPLHKNGWDDYETMNQLEDNIRNIANSRLLKEFESDIAELKNKYTKGE